jgi:hypothetical protein
MDPPTWTVSSKKRKSTPVSSLSSRKRRRSEYTTSSTTRPQQTLTQAQWISGYQRSSEDADLTFISERPAPAAKRRNKRHRDSTLTQMDFFAYKREPTTLADLQPISHDNIAIPQVDGPSEAPLPQYDGPYESPRKPRKRKSEIVLKKESVDSQEYKPGRRRKRSVNGESAGSDQARRSSRRLEEQHKILSDPAENFDYFERALVGHPQSLARTHSRAVLIVQDSTGSEEAIHLGQSPVPVPKTPTKPSPPVILSSQSPESLPPSTRRKVTTTGVPLERSPLAQRTANVARTPTAHAVTQYGKENAALNLSSKLRRPSKRPATVVADSQADTWSLPPTSSPDKMMIIVEDHDLTPEAGQAAPDPFNDLEIPSTSQIESGKAHESSEQSRVHEVVPAIPPKMDVDQPDTRTAIEVQGNRSQAMAEQDLDHHYDPPATPGVSKSTIEDTMSDFGSPIPNDTQFNRDVEQRTSSPAPANDQEPLAALTANPPEPPKLPSPRVAERSNSDLNLQPVESNSSNDTDGVSLPTMPPPALQQTYSMTWVPLNDIAPTSSPIPQPTTQRSVRPASMPHPSQISTQEGTQGYCASSYLPYQTTQAITERITIKDSSSMQVPMSQFPAAGQDEESQLDIDLGLDALDIPGPNADVDTGLDHALDDEDDDLNPPSTAPEPILPDQQAIPSSPPDHAQTLHQAPAPPTNAEAPPISSPVSSVEADSPPKLQRGALANYTQLEGFDNDTQSNFTQGGHVSAAYVHRQREAGVLPSWYTPRPFRPPGYTRR